MYNFELEKGSKKYTCPNCGATKKYRRIIDSITGEYAPFEFGRCERLDNCGYYRYPTKEHFAEKAQVQIGRIGRYKKGRNRNLSNYASNYENGSQATCEAEAYAKKPDYIPSDVLLRTLANYEQNAFIEFLLKLFPENIESVWQAVKSYCIGTTKDGKTIFWQIDKRRRVRTGKIIAYDADTGKRRKDIFPNWTHAELKRTRLLKPDFNLKQCFFGEHLLINRNGAAVAIVEAEKTAVICSIRFPEFVWLGAGSATNLNLEKLFRYKDRQIILYPDANEAAFDRWRRIALQASERGLCVKMSKFVEKRATDAEKVEGFDLADYLIMEMTKTNYFGSFAEIYNAALEAVLADEKILDNVETILDEQKTILINRGMSETEAEIFITNFDNVRKVVMSV